MAFILIKPYPLNILGGKAQLIERLVHIIDDCIENHGLVGVIDACMGGNRLFLTHHPEDELEVKIANDKDLGIYNFMKCIQDPYLTDELIDEICLTWDLYTSEKTFNEARIKRRDPLTPVVESAALTYILTQFGRAANKMLFNESNANKGIDPKSLDEKLLHLDSLLEGVEITQGDCIDIAKEFTLRDDFFLFLDVPYVEEDKKTGKVVATLDYEDGFTPEDQEKLLETLLITKNKVILCGYANPIYKERLEDNENSNFKRYFLGEVDVPSSANGRKRKEYIWCNFEISDDLLPYEPSDDEA